MSEVTLRPAPSSFPRPTTLYLPDLSDSTPSLVNTASYSPFPTIPGAKHDPHNLDRFLLSPNDPSWLYTLPPAADAMLPLGGPMSSSSSDKGSAGSRGLKKVRSFSMLHRPSPLSQPPVSNDEAEEEARQRKRSNSVDSIPSPIEAPTPAMLLAPESMDLAKANGRKSIRQAFQFRRKSVLSMVDLASEAATSTPLITPSVSSTSEEIDPTTPMSSRSNSNYSEVSSASSSSSSEGVKTPSEAAMAQIEVEIAGGKLAVALAAAGDKRNRKNSWMGWLGGKRTTKISGSGASTPISDLSAESSPNSSTLAVNLVPQLTLTPSPDILVPRVSSIVASDPSERSLNRGVTIEQMRRVSLTKLNQLRSPSAHPLALALRRQYSNLPDEIALSIQSGQKVFPMSVNVRGKTAGLNPMQGGLNTSLAVKVIMTKLERGEYPEMLLSARRSSDPMILPRPRGVLDFVNRSPYEERNIVLYPNGTFSPISMARPGYGVWDLDFSPYIVALSTIDSAPTAPWPTLPRASVGPSMDGLEELLSAVKDVQPSPTSEDEEVLVSPAPVMITLEEEPDKVMKEVEEPVSSFRNIKAISESSEESSDEEEEAEDDDDSPLASMFPKRTLSSITLAAPILPPARHERSRSTPNTKRVSIADDQTKKQQIMDEVARARDRRQANLTGETERRAEAERHRRPAPTAYKRSSTMDVAARRSSSSLNPPTMQSTSQSPPAPSRDVRRRTQSSYDMQTASKPEPTRRPSAPEGMPTKRFHSFYEAPIQPRPNVYPQQPVQMPMPMYPQQMYAHPGMHAFPGMSPRSSMVFPPQGYMQPMHPLGQMQPMMQMSPQHTGMYLQMQSRSSLVVPSSSRPGVSHRSSSAHQTRPRSGLPARS